MNTIKTAIVVILLLAVLYGVYVVINKPESLQTHLDSFQSAEAPLQIDSGTPFKPSESSAPLPGGYPSGSDGTDHHHATGSQTTVPANAAATTPSHVDLASGSQATVGSPQGDYSIPRDASPVEPPQVTLVNGFEDAWRTAVSDIQNGRFREALAALSVYYDRADLNSQQHQQLFDVLDPLAAKVIYSREHLLEDPYLVRRGDTLELVARKYDTSAQLLQNINGIDDPNVLVPGTRLKVLRGPFRAEVNLQSNRLTLFLGELYAGWFPTSIGDQPPAPGSYLVQFKEPGWVYYARNGQTIPARHATNPYGNWWIDLGGDVSIHGSPTSNTSNTAGLGCISLSPRDAADLYGILSEKNSQVEIRR